MAVLSGQMGRSQLQAVLGLAGRSNFITGYLALILEAGLDSFREVLAGLERSPDR